MSVNELISHHKADVNGFQMHYVTAGSGPPLVVLHGWPQSWYEWRLIIPALAERHTIIAPDLRGLGDSGKPAIGYDKRTLASDVAVLLRGLGHDQVDVLSHDWGGAVGFYLAYDNPGLVTRLMVLDMIPSLARRGEPVPLEQAIAPTFTHAFFHGGDPAWAEHLISKDVDGYLRRFLTSLDFNYSPAVFSEADIAEYVRVNSLPGAIRAGCLWYAAGLREDADNIVDVTEPLTIPVEVYGSERLGDLRPAWHAVARDVQGGTVPRCGHFIPEEAPQFVIDAARRFFTPPTV